MNNIPINTSVVAGVALAGFANEFKILLMKRAEEGFWCHVAGSIENGETAWQAILREFHEETGVTVKDLFSAEYLEQFYEADRNRITIIPVFVAFLSSDVQIQLNEEHTEFKWCTLAEARTMVPFPNQRNLYNPVWENFVAREPSMLWRVNQSTYTEADVSSQQNPRQAKR